MKFIKTAYDNYINVDKVSFVELKDVIYENFKDFSFYKIILWLDMAKVNFGCTKTKELALEIIEDIVNDRCIVGEYLTEEEVIQCKPN